MPPIRANTVLPAERTPVTLVTADGLRLVGELAKPPAGVPARGTQIWLHPLPTHGGSMDSHLLRKAAWRLPALAGIAVLRFNTRGTASAEGTSEGRFDGGNAERLDLAAAVELIESTDLPAPWLVGWSFGTDLALRWGWQDRSVLGAMLLAPPLKGAGEADLDAWARDGRSLVAIVPEYDDYLRPAEARRRFARVPQAVVLELPRAKHLFVGFAEEVFNLLVARMAPEAAPLASSYDGLEASA